MVAKSALVVLLVAALAYVAMADDSFKCYKCDNCDDVPKDEAQNLETCTTKCYVVATDKKGETKRGCSPFGEKECDDIRKEADFEKFKDSKCSTCKTDKCNTGSSATSIASSLGLTAVAAILLKAYY